MPFNWVAPGAEDETLKSAQIRLLQAAVARAPDDPRPRQRLTMLLCDEGRADEALASIKNRLATAPVDSAAWLELGWLHLGEGRYSDAEGAFARVDQESLSPQALLGLGTALLRQEKWAAALTLLTEAAERDPDSQPAARRAGTCQLQLGDGEALEASSRNAIARFSAVAWAISQLASALALQERREELRVLLDYDRLVSIVDLEAPAPFTSTTAFNAALAAELEQEAQFRWIGAESRRDSVVRSGRAAWVRAITKLAENQDSSLGRLVNAFKSEADGYGRGSCADPEHPHRLARPEASTLALNAHILRDEGRIAPHVHPNAWINAVYYVQVPGALGQSSEGDGWLRFAQSDHADARIKRHWPVLRVEPKPGRLVIFPSFCSHHVTPTRSDDPRLTITFEVEGTSLAAGGHDRARISI